MQQSGKSIQNSNLQEFLDSASNAAKEGQQQFYTPKDIAASLFRPLPAVRKHLVTDLHFGSGHLALGSGADTCLGLDIDSRILDLRPPRDRGSKIEDRSSSSSTIHNPQSTISTKWHLDQCDLTRWYPIAHEAGIQFPFITINPPFSLRWYADRLTHLRDSTIPEVAAAAAAHPEQIDSTLASFLIALDRLLPYGEGFMVCNANTARRFFGDPQSSSPSSKLPASSLMRFIWLWLEIPGFLYENQMTEFDTAVLYFSRSHGTSLHTSHSALGTSSPLYLRASTGTAAAVDAALMIPEVFTAHRGHRYHFPHDFYPQGIIETWKTVSGEYADRHKGRLPAWNITLDERGRIKTYLTPFQKVSRKIPKDLANRLHALNGHPPIALCVTATSRTALREATECGIWRVDPAVTAAIRQAMEEHAAQAAPFYRPNTTQALGWVDENSALRCIEEGIGDAKPGDMCSIACSIEPTEWKGERINLAGNPEELAYTGRELLVKLTDPSGCQHYFHVRRDDAKKDPDTDPHTGKIKCLHWHASDLTKHFHIPIPQDIAELRPADYQAKLAIIDQIEARVRQNMAKAG